MGRGVQMGPKLHSQSCNLSDFLQTEPGIYFLKNLWGENHLGSLAGDLSASWPCQVNVKGGLETNFSSLAKSSPSDASGLISSCLAWTLFTATTPPTSLKQVYEE